MRIKRAIRRDSRSVMGLKEVRGMRGVVSAVRRAKRLAELRKSKARPAPGKFFVDRTVTKTKKALRRALFFSFAIRLDDRSARSGRYDDIDLSLVEHSRARTAHLNEGDKDSAHAIPFVGGVLEGDMKADRGSRKRGEES